DQHAHEGGRVRRDIQPHNLSMSVRDGLIRVADLGLARLPRAMNAEATAALTGGVKGSGTLTPENVPLPFTPPVSAAVASAFMARGSRASPRSATLISPSRTLMLRLCGWISRRTRPPSCACWS